MAVNRIKLSPTNTASTATSLSISPSADSMRDSSELAHSVFVPIHYEPNYRYPLIVWLHGEGGDHPQLQQIMPLVSVRNYVAVAPRGTIAGSDGQAGYDWWQGERDIHQAETRILQCIRSAKNRYSIDNDRVLIAGYSRGGTMAMRIGLRNPDMFAGAITIGGALPRKHRPLENLLQSRSLPLLISQGRDAEQYSVDHTCEDLRLLHAGGFSVTLRQYPCGNELTTQMLSDMNRWIMELVTGQNIEVSEPPFRRSELN